MLFSSLTFLFIFLPFVLIIYYIIPMVARNYFLLFASLIFYAWGEPTYLLVMLGVIVFNYILGRIIDKFQQHGKVFLSIAVIGNLAVLCTFKYADFFIQNINILLTNKIDLLEIVLPIGISFYIFQSLSYVIDVYRKVVTAQKNIFKFALYISMFPQLIAGPIVKYRDIMNYLDNRLCDIDNVVEGIRRFIIGLSKKVIIANTMGGVADKIFASGSGDISTCIAWIGAIAYSLQIFFDFSGYSDMAIGLGRMFGFRFMENFNYPYIATSMTDFWRRWHISLSMWFKDYVYIPLGGNRCSALRHNINLFAVFFLTGLWHGASWSFVVWGLWHGLFIVLEKRISVFYKTGNIINAMKHIYVIMVFVIGWVFFRADNLGEAVDYINVMMGLNVPEHISFEWQYYVHNKFVIVGVFAVLCCYPWKIFPDNKSMSIIIAKDAILLLMLFTSIMFIAAGSYNPFIYFRF